LYTAHQHLAGEDIAFVVHLGDYIYEGGVTASAVRQHDGPEIMTLAAYRNRYALYKSDPDLRSAHAAFPWIATWDDHEVANNYADDRDQRGSDPAAFLLRRAAAYQAYYEHMPLRRSSMPRGADAQLYRRLAFGSLATVHVIDTRQYRTDQPCGDGNRVECAEARDERATILGSAQERWLHDGLRARGAIWNVIANQLPIAPVALPTTNGLAYSVDKWSGYVRERDRLIDVLGDRRVANPVVVTGDVHVNMVADINRAPEREDGPTVATEFVSTSISSGGNGVDLSRGGQRQLDANPHLRFHNGQRGYIRCTVTADRWTSDYRVVPYVDRPGAPIDTRASFVVQAGRRGVERS
jgi:alkaline phosphatase D